VAKRFRSDDPIDHRLGRVDWKQIEDSLWELGYAKTPAILTPAECGELIELYSDDSRFRSRIDMERYRFGIGEYKYFAYPLPAIVKELREHAYPPLAAIANRWMEALGSRERYPAELSEFLEACHQRAQRKPTPLLLRYKAGGYNCLHQDLYGDVAFPIQLTCFLSRPGADYSGGEFLLVEQRPRAQSKGKAIATNRGEILIFTTRYRPVRGARGYYKVNVRHGVSRLLSGTRSTLGVIFHDAK